jgi:hypothetical protein
VVCDRYLVTGLNATVVTVNDILESIYTVLAPMVLGTYMKLGKIIFGLELAPPSTRADPFNYYAQGR